MGADQVDRLARLRAASAVVRASPPELTRSPAAAWLARQLPARPAGVTTVVFHSVVWPYLTLTEQHTVTQLLEQAGGQASPQAPLAWLRLEPSPEEASARLELRLTWWPAGAERRLAAASPHGQDVWWYGEDAGDGGSTPRMSGVPSDPVW